MVPSTARGAPRGSPVGGGRRAAVCHSGMPRLRSSPESAPRRGSATPALASCSKSSTRPRATPGTSPIDCRPPLRERKRVVHEGIDGSDTRTSGCPSVTPSTRTSAPPDSHSGDSPDAERSTFDSPPVRTSSQLGERIVVDASAARDTEHRSPLAPPNMLDLPLVRPVVQGGLKVAAALAGIATAVIKLRGRRGT